MKRKCVWLVISHVVGMATAMFYYDKGKGQAIDSAKVDKGTYFGYSLSYQKDLNNLVVGAPNDVTGNVFTCPLSLDSTNINIEKKCTRYDKVKDYVNKLSNTQRYAEDYQFRLGTSVAALNNSASFVTCAPMWSGNFSEIFVWGACFKVTNNKEEVIQLGDKMYGSNRRGDTFRGNFGMRMFADDINDLILISKPASTPVCGDVVYTKQTSPLNNMKSLTQNEDPSVIDMTKQDDVDEIFIYYRNLGISFASGNFFKKEKHVKAIYAIGTTDKKGDGQVIFLNLMSDGQLMKKENNGRMLQVKGGMKFSMLGASLVSASLKNDGDVDDEYTDLIVSAPARQGKNEMDVECGAVHIYLGSKDEGDFVELKLTIIGNEEGSRFGSAIAANDLDKDGLSEIFISALYEKEGVLYILSGYEMREKLKRSLARPIVHVKDFNSRQEISKKDGFKLLGFSIFPVSDLDQNGCDELAVGAPGSDKVLLLQCIPTIKIFVTAELMDFEVIPQSEQTFQVNVCIRLEYKSKTDTIAADVEMENNIVVNDGMKKSVQINETDKTFTFDISTKNSTYCRPVKVHIDGYRPETYKFQARAKLINKEFDKSTFNPSWVRESPDSPMKMKAPLVIKRECKGKDCVYNLTMDFMWSGGELDTKAVPAGKYAVGSKDENMTIRISNWGRLAYDACVLIKVEHAPLNKLLGCTVTPEGHQCRLPAGFMTNETKDIDIHLATSSLTDEYKSLQVTADLYNECDSKVKSLKQNIIIDYEFNADELSVEGSPDTKDITEKSMKADGETIDVSHTYMIKNKGAVLWKNVSMDIVVPQEIKDFVKELKVHPLTCTSIQASSVKCTLDVERSSKTRIAVTVVLNKKEIESSLVENNLKVITELTLQPRSTTINKHARVEAALVYEKDSSIAQDKTLIILIAVIVALIIIAIVIFILYKLGFFKRKQKEKLEQEIKRRSVRRSNATSQRADSLVEITEEDMDEDAFHCDDASANCASTSADRQSTRVSRRSITKETDNLEIVTKETGRDQ